MKNCKKWGAGPTYQLEGSQQGVCVWGGGGVPSRLDKGLLSVRRDPHTGLLPSPAGPLPCPACWETPLPADLWAFCCILSAPGLSLSSFEVEKSVWARKVSVAQKERLSSSRLDLQGGQWALRLTGT